MKTSILIVLMACTMAPQGAAQASLIRAGQNTAGALVSLGGTSWLVSVGELKVSLRPVTATASEGEAEIPVDFSLHGNFPNPFNPTTTLVFDLDEAADVRVEIADVTGRLVRVIPAQKVAAGAQRMLNVDVADLSSGTYLYRVIARTSSGVRVGTGRMVLLK